MERGGEGEPAVAVDVSLASEGVSEEYALSSTLRQEEREEGGEEEEKEEEI